MRAETLSRIRLFRVDPALDDLISRAAAAENVTPSSWIRQSLASVVKPGASSSSFPASASPGAAAHAG